MNDENKSIKCDVKSCEFNCNNEFCTLNQIKVSSNKKNCENKLETICDSFIEKETN